MEVPQRNNKKRSGARHPSIYRTILLVAGLSGCAMMPPAPAPLPAVPAPEPVPAVVVPQGSARELFIAGVDVLQHGDGQKAKPLLQQVLVLEPNHKDAATLLQQIDANPVEMLGKENFPYKVQPGDTLSLIAKRFLGDRFKFYILARYNGLAVSDKLEAGQSIKIPGKKPPPPKAPVVTVATVATVAEQPPPPDTSSSRLAEARAEQAYQEGNQWLNDGEPEKAYTAYAKALKLAPEHAGAKTALLKIKAQTVDAYYADAARARRRQNYTEALDYLDKLLEIDPNHEKAKANRLEIKAILDRERAEQQR